MITLDSYFLGRRDIPAIDFLKIDTEGFEYEVLLGSQGVLEKLSPKVVQIEYNWHQLFRSQSLYSLSLLLPNYQAYQMLPGRLAKRDPRDPLSNIFYFSNFLFVRKDCLFLVGKQ